MVYCFIKIDLGYLIGAHQAENGQQDEGLVKLYYGAQTNIKKIQHLESNQVNARFGYSASSAGDIDGDGFSDVIIGARYYTNGAGQTGEGAAFIYRGSAAGLIDNPVVIEGNQYGAAMGNKVSSAGDVNGDTATLLLVFHISPMVRHLRARLMFFTDHLPG